MERVRTKEVEAMELLRTLELHAEEAVRAEDVLSRFEDDFDLLLGEFAGEYEELGLDEVVVGAIAPIVSCACALHRPPAETHNAENPFSLSLQLRRLWQSWDPLLAPTYTVSQLKKFRKLFLIDKHAAPSRSFAASTDLDVYGQQVRAEQDAETRRKQAERQMSPYETLMWTVWLPKIRSSIKSVAAIPVRRWRPQH